MGTGVVVGGIGEVVSGIENVRSDRESVCVNVTVVVSVYDGVGLRVWETVLVSVHSSENVNDTVPDSVSLCEIWDVADDDSDSDVL